MVFIASFMVYVCEDVIHLVGDAVSQGSALVHGYTRGAIARWSAVVRATVWSHGLGRLSEKIG